MLSPEEYAELRRREAIAAAEEAKAATELATRLKREAAAVTTVGVVDEEADEARMAVAEIKRKLDTDHLRVVDLFNRWDKDKSGAIGKAELKLALSSIGYSGEIDKVWRLLDVDGTGKIELNELQHAVAASGSSSGKRRPANEKTPGASPTRLEDAQQAAAAANAANARAAAAEAAALEAEAVVTTNRAVNSCSSRASPFSFRSLMSHRLGPSEVGHTVWSAAASRAGALAEGTRDLIVASGTINIVPSGRSPGSNRSAAREAEERASSRFR